MVGETPFSWWIHLVAQLLFPMEYPWLYPPHNFFYSHSQSCSFFSNEFSGFRYNAYYIRFPHSHSFLILKPCKWNKKKPKDEKMNSAYKITLGKLKSFMKLPSYIKTFGGTKADVNDLQITISWFRMGQIFQYDSSHTHTLTPAKGVVVPHEDL